MNDVPFEFRIWDAQACAEHFGQSKEYFLRTTRHAKGFPKQTEASEDGQPRWRALKVAEWGIK